MTAGIPVSGQVWATSLKRTEFFTDETYENRAFNQVPFCLDLEGGYVIGEHILTDRAELVRFEPQLKFSAVYRKDPSITRILREGFFPLTVPHFDTTVVYIFRWGYMNYGHWFHDVIPSLKIIQQVNLGEEYLLHIPYTLSYQKETLKLLGYGPDRIIPQQRYPNLSASRLLFPYVGCRSARWVKEYIRSEFLPHIRPAGRSNRRVYISRKDAGTRHIINEDELMTFLQKFGFEMAVMSRFTFQEQAELFRECKIIVVQHGAAMANTFFCNPGCKVIQIWNNYSHFLHTGEHNFNPVYPDHIDRHDYICPSGNLLPVPYSYWDILIDMRDFENYLRTNQILE
jgi:capsular polysaccharide biosynthesis protein